MIYEILPKKIYCAPVKNFEACQEEVARALPSYNFEYRHSPEWGKLAMFDDSNSLDVIGEHDMQNIKNEIMDAIAIYDPEYQWTEHSRPESILLKYQTGDYSHVHGHQYRGHEISGCYFHKVPEEGHLFFVDRENGASFHLENITEGHIILFPPYLWHGVTRVTGDKITLAFSVSF